MSEVARRWVEPYLSIPWAQDGEGGENCWSLVRRVVGQQLGVDVVAVSYPDTVRGLAGVFDQTGKRADVWTGWRDCACVDDAPDGAVVFMGQGARVHHAGVLVKDVGVLHITKNLGVVVLQSFVALKEEGWTIARVVEWCGSNE